MIVQEIQSHIETVENNLALYEEPNFRERADAIDYIEFNILDRIESMLPAFPQANALAELKQYADHVKHQLEKIDEQLFQRLRVDIRAGTCKGESLKEMIDLYIGRTSIDNLPQDEIGFDYLDIFINGLLQPEPPPDEIKEREPEMVYYQQTPTRIILALAEKAELTAIDKKQQEAVDNHDLKAVREGAAEHKKLLSPVYLLCDQMQERLNGS